MAVILYYGNAGKWSLLRMNEKKLNWKMNVVGSNDEIRLKWLRWRWDEVGTFKWKCWNVHLGSIMTIGGWIKDRKESVD